MSKLEVNVIDRGPVNVPPGSNLLDVARAGEVVDALVAERDGDLRDLTTPARDGDAVKFFTYDDAEGRDTTRHTAAHILAQALTERYPQIKLAIGPATADGFYYDFDAGTTLTDDDLLAIESLMKEIITRDVAITRQEINKDEARRIFANNPYKLELIGEVEGDAVTVYRQDAFVDLCRGPHLPSTGAISGDGLKITALAGAYWRGDEKNDMLTRVYGTTFRTAEELDQHLARIQEAKRRDHRTLGRDLELFSIAEERGAGLVYWHPNGAFVRDRVESFWKEEHKKRGYQLVSTPHIAQARLFESSGHFKYFLDNMYTMDVDGVRYVLKPMNCPMHIAIYKSTVHSYRDMPIRYAELGTVYRKERSGTLHGLLRVRGFTQDDAHIFCTPEQIVDELCGCLDLGRYLLNTFGFSDYELNISAYDAAHPEKYAGTPAEWQEAEAALEEALIRSGLPFVRKEGEAVFYGPKIDIQIFDALGRKWQGPTIQFDFNLPARFGVNYIGPDGAEHQCFMVHRALLGSMERFFGNLIEHYGGVFPPWLAPVHLRIIPVSAEYAENARAVKTELETAGMRVDIDASKDRLNAKIRNGETSKIPYLAVMGKKEVADRTLSLRRHGGDDLGPVPIDRVIRAWESAVSSRALDVSRDGLTA